MQSAILCKSVNSNLQTGSDFQHIQAVIQGTTLKYLNILLYKMYVNV